MNATTLRTRLNPLILALALVIGPMAPPAQAAVLLNDSFDRADGPITNDLDSGWTRHSGVEGETQITSGLLELTRSQTEDLHHGWNAAFSGDATEVFYGFDLIVRRRPSNGGAYFATINHTISQARLFLYSTPDDPDDRFRMALSNASGDRSLATAWEEPLPLDVSIRIVVRYEITSGNSQLWVSPENSSSPKITASDTPSPRRPTTFVWRQASGLGEIGVDDLVVATQFAEVLSTHAQPPIPGLEVQDDSFSETGSNSARLHLNHADQLNWETDTRLVFGGSATFSEDYALQVRSSEGDVPLDWEAISTSAIRLLPPVRAPRAVIALIPIDDSLQEGVETVTVRLDTTPTASPSEAALNLEDNDAPGLLWDEPFDYAVDTPLVEATAVWRHHSGEAGETLVREDGLVLSRSASEDLHRTLPSPVGIDAPHEFLYWRVSARVDTSPSATGAYILHWNTQAHKTRLFLKWEDSMAPQGLRFGVNPADANPESTTYWPEGFSLGEIVDIVVRHNLSSGQSALWINDPSLSAAPAVAETEAAPDALSELALRQSTGMGVVTIHRIRVATNPQSLGLITASASPGRWRIVKGPTRDIPTFHYDGPASTTFEISSDLWDWAPLSPHSAPDSPTEIAIPEPWSSAKRLFLRAVE